MKYQDAIKQCMDDMAKKGVIFLGYNTKCGNKGMGCFRDIPQHQLIETPVAENLMMGMAIGMSLEGLTPLVYFERFDFILNAIDSIVNHLDKLADISNNEFKPFVVIRVVVGNSKKPFFGGLTHTQDYSEALRHLTKIPVINLYTVNDILTNYGRIDKSVILVEYKDLYE